VARVIVTDLADADTAKILHDISRDAGQLVASRYITDIEALYDKLDDFPESCQMSLQCRCIT
jgi:toxin ParE1/3/4